MLRVDGLKKRMPGFLLEASFSVQASERLAVVGRSGAGKTSLLRLLAGLEPLLPKTDSGRIVLSDRDLTRVPVQEREIGFVFQDQALFSGRSVFENVAFGLKMRGVPPEEQRSRVSEWLNRLGLSSRAQEKVDHLSGGERQRVALARALITRPRLLLLDEPFVGLDAAIRRSLSDEILRLHAENPVPLLFVSHEAEDLERFSTGRIRVDETDDGKVRRALRV